MERDQEALAWAHANPGDPRSKNIQAKVWANANPDDPRSIKIMDQLSKGSSTPPAPSGNPFNVADTQQKLSDMSDKQIKVSGDGSIQTSDPELNKFSQAIKVTPDTVNQMAANSVLPGMAGTLAKGAGALTRLGIGAGIGAGQGVANTQGGDNLSKATGGAALGLVGAGAMEGIQSLLGGIGGAAGNVKRAMQYSNADPALQTEARNKMVETVSNLNKTQVPVNLSHVMGTNPGIDALILKRLKESGQQVGTIANLDGKTMSDIGKLSPVLGNTASSTLERQSNNPITALTSSNVDQRARINSASQAAGTNLSGYAKDLIAAKNTAESPIKSGIATTLKQGVKGAASSLSDGPGAANDPRSLSTILNLLKGISG